MSALVSTRMYIYARVCVYVFARVLAHQDDWLEEAFRCPVLLPSIFAIIPSRRSRLKIIPTFNDYKNAWLLFRERERERERSPDRSPAVIAH